MLVFTLLISQDTESRSGLFGTHLIWFEYAVDNEWREQRENLIREGPDQLTYSHLAASYYPPEIKDLELFIAYDKPWDEDFQDIPGTPGRGDQLSFGGTYRRKGSSPSSRLWSTSPSSPFCRPFIWPDWECLVGG